MNWLTKLERKFGRFAIPNLMYYIIICYGLGFILTYINPSFYTQYLSLNIEAVFHGQIWRVITFIIRPPSASFLFIILVLYFYYMIGKQLEMSWGAFRFNLYFFAGVLFHVIAAIIVYLITGVSLQIDAWYLNLSMLLAFAAMYPDMQFYWFGVIPIKAKWMALLDAALFLWTIIKAFLPAYSASVYAFHYKAEALAAAVSILNFVIFFMGSRNAKPFSPKEIRRKKEFKTKIRPENQYAGGAKHKCAVCGRTELDDETLEFRYCSKCNGNYEYCQDHLFTHTHVK